MCPHTTKYNGWLPAASVAAVPEIAPCSSQSPAVRKTTTHGTTLSLSAICATCTSCLICCCSLLMVSSALVSCCLYISFSLSLDCSCCCSSCNMKKRKALNIVLTIYISESHAVRRENPRGVPLQAQLCIGIISPAAVLSWQSPLP